MEYMETDDVSQVDRTGATGHLQLPIFNDPEVSRVKRAAVVDIGSNSVRLVVFDGAARSPAFFYNEKVMCGLGASLSDTGCLDRSGKERALAAIQRFVAIAEGMNASAMAGVATAACRMAEDGKAFCHQITEMTGLSVRIASGSEEARLAAQGVILGWPLANGLVCDIGGASMELAEVRSGSIGKCLSAPMGPMLFSPTMPRDHMSKEIEHKLRMIRRDFSGQYGTIYLVGGSWRAIAKIDMASRDYPLRVMNEYLMSRNSLVATLDSIEKAETDGTMDQFMLQPERLKHLPTAARILRSMISVFQPDGIAVSAYGIREGMLYEQMPERLRHRDPLIEACLHAEYSSARMPGFGQHLHRFIRPLFKKCNSAQKRLVRAACILHDVSWRAHPDYRSVACFDFATRASLAGIDHAGRVFLALSLFNRYKSVDMPGYARDMLALLQPEERDQAVLVGKAIRFAAMLAVVSPERIGRLRFKPRKHELILELPSSLHIIHGEVVADRFRSVAAAMNCRPRIVLK